MSEDKISIKTNAHEIPQIYRRDQVDSATFDQYQDKIDHHLKLARKRPSGSTLIDIQPTDEGDRIYIVAEDTPFLVDSILIALREVGIQVTSVDHPVFVAYRDRDTSKLHYVQDIPTESKQDSLTTTSLPKMTDYISEDDDIVTPESWIAIDTTPISSAQKKEVTARLHSVVEDVRYSVRDWAQMRQKARDASQYIQSRIEQGLPEEVEEQFTLAGQFLDWIENNHFTFLGYREYALEDKDGKNVLTAFPETGLGILSPDNIKAQAHYTVPQKNSSNNDSATAYAQQKKSQVHDFPAKSSEQKSPLTLTKANSRSTVHRSSYLDYIGIKTYNEDNIVNGELRFIGLFASNVYTGSVTSIPVVNKKVQDVISHFGFMANSHNGREVIGILENYPRAELFQISTEELIEAVDAIMGLKESGQVKVIIRPDKHSRFMSVLVYLPRDQYTTAVRQQIEQNLRDAYDVESLNFETRVTEDSMARLFYRVLLTPGEDAKVKAQNVPKEKLSKEITQTARPWSEDLAHKIATRFPDKDKNILDVRWKNAFPPAYTLDNSVDEALADIERFEYNFFENRNPEEDPQKFNQVVRVVDPDPNQRGKNQSARLKLYLSRPRSLSLLLPVLSRLGIEIIEEQPYTFDVEGKNYYLYDLKVNYPQGTDPQVTEGLLSQAVAGAFLGVDESDYLGQLIIKEEFTPRQVNVLRAYLRYGRQLGIPYSYSHLTDVLVENGEATKLLLELFETRFDPKKYQDSEEREKAYTKIDQKLLEQIDTLETLDEDKIIRLLRNVITSTLRTNYYQDKPYLAFKMEPQKIEMAPDPKPQYEIWVYSSEVEGVHLRFGDVSRGGLRWSDRREDFRTEILGLVKAQQVKNAVIVPNGAKGGFYGKKLPDPNVDRAKWLEAGKNSYKTFIQGLLDITDNLELSNDDQKQDELENVLRYDDDDPYLVVAADKGTASFSDLANSISENRDFWLGDAFASGGSVGYDHKAMGITARGAWESVKRHFMTQGFDTQNGEFTVVGIGDMSGDVFGNGMLLSPGIRLVAAFDHRHIFLDPDPDPAQSFKERQRLFELPRSSWADYNKDFLSEGAMIISRQEKNVTLTPEIMEILGTKQHEMTINELLKTILKAPADLLYNGGIGTYIKASTESNESVGDRANDPLRIDGHQIRAKVVGEGGNLGLTQAARIEAAKNGVLINTDAIDNSAGVDCSDHEVNIKILVDNLVRDGKIDPNERADFLADMTDNVADLVLKDNIDQNALLVVDKDEALKWSSVYERFISSLEANAGLNRELENLPSAHEIQKRAAKGQGLTSPELSVLAAYAKIYLADRLTHLTAQAKNSVIADKFTDQLVHDYFPEKLQESFSEDIAQHPLRNEIVSTILANKIINLGGITFAFRAEEDTNTDIDKLAKAFLIASELFDLQSMYDRLNTLGVQVPVEKWTKFQMGIRRVLDRTVRWLITNEDLTVPVKDIIGKYSPIVSQLAPHIDQFLTGQDTNRSHSAKEQASQWNIPDELVDHWVNLFESFTLLDIISIAQEKDLDPAYVAAVYFGVYDHLNIDEFLNNISQLSRDDRWQNLARSSLREDLYSTVSSLVSSVLNNTESPSSPVDPSDKEAVDVLLAMAKNNLEQWESQSNSETVKRVQKTLEMIDQSPGQDLAILSVGVRVLRSLIR